MVKAYAYSLLAHKHKCTHAFGNKKLLLSSLDVKVERGRGKEEMLAEKQEEEEALVWGPWREIREKDQIKPVLFWYYEKFE